MSLGRNLMIMLYDKKMSQTELAREIGVAQGTVSNYIRDERIPSLARMMHIARVLGTTVEELMKDEDSK